MNINSTIAKTYIFSNKKLTAVAVLGVLLGMSVYIFMNSLLVGFDKSSNTSIFRNTSHIRVYKDDEISKPLINNNESKSIIVNPKVVPIKNTIINPNLVLETILKQKEVTVVTPQVNTNVFYHNGKSQISGLSVGIKPDEANLMYDINSFMADGNFDFLKSNPNGIVIGSGIAEKMNLTNGDNLNLTSSKGINRTFKVVGIFKTNNSVTDKTKSYINLSASQQLLKEGNSYITDINVNVTDPEIAEKVATKLTQITGYKAEGWKQANETLMANNKMRKMIITFVSLTILLVAGFGIYNILNMTVSQKINDIAILKAMGFKGKDVIRIFVTQAISIGIMGVLGGVVMATILITILKRVYLGGDIGYFPIDYEPQKFVQGVVIGLIITFFAGYIPAKKAANVDPVDILRK
ncbi:ABC transporter permease [Empedobacter brevis]|uniref:ABC transporter permease n=2 Tax=Empedobacter TaxID=59734 RepID=A0AAW7DQD8_9FLAO|nr:MULTISPECIES: ABC transporter permease [Empedobacter]MDM1074322.1 ABC transporter permease [Empedobacter brevis]MDM1549499.1 ABC transporter permease [Empedobacter falsenii]MDM1552870.1 ABC transporter permease [Empedobacter falsenii]